MGKKKKAGLASRIHLQKKRPKPIEILKAKKSKPKECSVVKSKTVKTKKSAESELSKKSAATPELSINSQDSTQADLTVKKVIPVTEPVIGAVEGSSAALKDVVVVVTPKDMGEIR